MNKRTWKVQGMAGAAARAVATSPNVSAAAKTAGVNRSTLYRWAKTGKIPALTRQARRAVSSPAAPVVNRTTPLSAAEWATSIQCAYDLDDTEHTLVNLAEAALELARDLTLRPADRLAAMARFQGLVKQLALEAPDGEVAIPDTRFNRSAWAGVLR
jgi:transposase-like protein